MKIFSVIYKVESTVVPTYYWFIQKKSKPRKKKKASRNYLAVVKLF